MVLPTCLHSMIILLKSRTNERASGLRLYSMELYLPRNAMSEYTAWNRTILGFETSGFSILHQPFRYRRILDQFYMHFWLRH